MKKIIGLIISLVLLTGMLIGCSAAPAENTDASENIPSDAQTSEPDTKQDDVTPDDEAAWPRTIIDGAGNEIVLEKAPERVSLLHIVYMEHFLLLDSPPTASAIGNKLGRYTIPCPCPNGERIYPIWIWMRL
ncbi:hypothetical protein [Sedimentibacter sp.]|uniref:hypothetical protein n=1 Tax=Sedimentibacter sp. TaxID=1960295 RepID=UPI00289754A0|nr:hypothetical protein [Sedimentibacter sp.]